MRTIAVAATTAALLGSASAFVAPTLPSASRPAAPGRASATKMMLSPDDLLTGTQNLVAIVKENDVFVKNAGDYPWGSVQAPDWALPVAAIGTLSFGVLIPLFLRSGVDAFNAGGAVGAEKKAAAAGRPVPTKAGKTGPAAKATAAKTGPAKAAGAAKAGGVKAAGGKAGAKGAAAAAAPAPKKKGWF